MIKVWNMKTYSIYAALLLFLLAACTDDRECGGQDNRKFRVTASIEDADAMTRVADKDNRTSFTKNDAIHIGWSGGASSYKFLYSGANNVFAPNDTDADRSLWSDMLKTTGPTVDVYAWYGTMNSSLPAVGATVSIPQDQTLESKLLSAICMAAHQTVSTNTYTLNFSFQHLTARLFLSVDIVDPTVTQTDVMSATAQINHIYTDGTIAIDGSGDYKLSVPDDKSGTGSIHMKQSWSDQEIFHLDLECLLPPQTLGGGQSVTITLGSGKEYVCSISGDLALTAGQKTTLSATLKADAGADFKPKLTTIPNAETSAYSGNRLICCILNSTTKEYRYRVYDKQPDGSWGEGVLVYEDEEGAIEFPTQQYSSIVKIGCRVEISGDYAVLSNDIDNNSTYFIKKSKRTGKWYCANGRIQGHGYSVCISNDFLVSGNHLSGGTYRNHAYIYPIDENGNLGAVQDSPAGISAYKCSIYGGVLATNNGVYEYDEDKKQWVKLFGYPVGRTNQQRVATDGKRVIMQTGDGESDVYIYNVKTGQEEGWEGTKAKAGVGKPIAIYGDYALAGKNYLNICYRDPATGKWRIINPDGGFLEMMKHWDKSITLTTINGENISMKGTRAMIAGNSIGSIFIENIDKMVEDYLTNPY